MSRNVKGTKADARKVRDRLRQEHEQGLVAKADKITFGEFSTEWFERRGEILGISWRNLDLEAGVATIKDNLNKTDGLKVPKTDAGYRKVSLDPATVESLVRWRDYQKVALMRIGVEVTEESPVFTSGTGDYMNPSGFSRWWRKFSKEAGFEGLKFHELRHTQATVFLANKVDVKTVRTRLGHANASITLNLYAHAVPENDREAADLVGDLFNGGKPRATRKEDLREAV